MRRLVLNADDFGYEPRVTAGIVEAMRRGVVSSTTMIVNGPFSAEAAEHAEGLAIGLHLNLARWESVAGKGALEESKAGGLTRGFVAEETEAQLERLRRLIGREATHIDVHKHLHRHEEVLEGVAMAAKARGLAVRSIDEAMRGRLRALGVETNDVFVGDAGAEPYWTVERFIAALDELPREGFIELMCHPGYAPERIASGYGPQREVELETFVSKAAREACEERGIVFEGWG